MLATSEGTHQDTQNSHKKAKKRSLSQISIPGLHHIPILEVGKFFIQGMQKGALSTRAASISFQFLLAAIPGFGFLLTLVPYIPIPNFQEGIMALLRDLMPVSAFSTITFAIDDVFTKRLGLQLLGFVTAVFFATNGVSSVIKAFNATYHSMETRSWLEQKYISIFLVVVLTVLITTSISFIIFTRTILELMVQLGIIRKFITFYLLNSGKWIIVFMLIFSAISFLYYYAPAKKSQLRFFNFGALVASFLTVIASLGFSFFMNHFGKFDELYGSIGALMVILIWINFNSIALLIGFEINVSIANAQSKRNTDLLTQEDLC